MQIFSIVFSTLLLQGSVSAGCGECSALAVEETGAHHPPPALRSIDFGTARFPAEEDLLQEVVKAEPNPEIRAAVAQILESHPEAIGKLAQPLNRVLSHDAKLHPWSRTLDDPVVARALAEALADALAEGDPELARLLEQKRSRAAAFDK